LASFYSFALLAEETQYMPKAKHVTANVYAFIGPLGQRSEKNDGLNNNLGFIVANKGVILIDSGASRMAAQRLEKAVSEITRLPIKWVINTGSQDHRWLGNDYFASKGADIIALQRTAESQAQNADQQMDRMAKFLGKRFKGTKATPASQLLQGEIAKITLGGQQLELQYTDAHYPGDAWVWLAHQSVIFTGDLIYVDRVFTVLPFSSVVKGQKAFHAMEKLNPKFIVPGHGGISDINKAKTDCGDYYEFLVDKIGRAAQEMEPMQELFDRYTKLPKFQHLEHFDSLHRTNMNRTYLEFEQM